MKASRPSPLAWLPLAGILKVSAFFQGMRCKKKIKMRKPAIILSNHASFRDYVFVTATLYPHRVNFLAADKMFFQPERGPFLRLGKAIPTCSFQGDARAVAMMLKIVKQKGIVGIFPEGQISSHGRSFILPTGIARLLKKAACDVYVVKIENAALMAPPWSLHVFKGRVTTRMEHLFTPEELASSEENAIFDKVSSALFFDAGATNKERRWKYRLQPINNLENLIFRCSECGHEGLECQGNALICPQCGHRLVYDEYGLLNGESVSHHYDRERDEIENELAQAAFPPLIAPVKLVKYQDNRLDQCGEGQLTLTREAYLYEGIDNGRLVTYRFLTKDVQYLPSDIGGNVQIYHDYKYYQFDFQTKHLPTKFVIAGEYYYRLQKQE